MQTLSGCIRNSIRYLGQSSTRQAARLQLTPHAGSVGHHHRNMSHGTIIYSADQLSEKLSNELKAEHVDIVDLSNCGCGMKFDAVIVSPKFEGKPILQRQRLVNQILSEEMKHIHAFTMLTLTPDQWKKKMEADGIERTQ